MFAYHLLLTLHIVSAATLAVLLGIAFHSRREPAAPWFGGVVGALLLWTVAYTLELAVPDLGDKLVWANVQFIGASTLPVLWLMAVRVTVGKPTPRRWIVIALSVIAGGIIVCAVVNPGHLFRIAPTLDVSGPFPLVAADYGWLYYLSWVPFAYGLFSVTIFTLCRSLLYGPRELRVRCALLLAATLLPMVAGGLFVTGALPWPNFNPAMASISVAAIIVGCVMLSGRLLDVTPLARETVVEQLDDGVIVCDAKGRVTDCNPAALALLPELRVRAVGRPLEDIVAGCGELSRALAAARGDAPASGAAGDLPGAPLHIPDEALASVEVTTSGAGSAPRHRHVAVVATPLLARSGRRVGETVVLRDVTTNVDLLQQLRRLAITDELTGLYTRGHLLELGRREIDRARRKRQTIAVLLLDVDGFKAINDQHGHLAGDELLRAVAAVCRDEVRSFDVLARYGGDEFAALLPDLGPDEARAAAERLRCAIASMTVRHRDVRLAVTVSIGVACGGRPGETMTDLIETADAALYEAKARGRDQVALAEPRASLLGA